MNIPIDLELLFTIVLSLIIFSVIRMLYQALTKSGPLIAIAKAIDPVWEAQVQTLDLLQDFQTLAEDVTAIKGILEENQGLR